jgi:putative endonuclease
MHDTNQKKGSIGEDISADYLINSGYFILERNFRCKKGEIDIIAKDKDYLTFIEVKTRSSNFYGSPGEAVNFTKKQRIYKSAQLYILTNRLFDCKFRFDVVEVILRKNNTASSIKIIKDAFQINN